MKSQDQVDVLDFKRNITSEGMQSEKDEFDKELTVSPELQKAVDDHHQLQRETATTLVDVAGL